MKAHTANMHWLEVPLLGKIIKEQVTSGLPITWGHVPQFELYNILYWIAGQVRAMGLQVKIIFLDKRSIELIVISCGGGYGSVTKK